MRLILIFVISLMISAGVYAQTPTEIARSLNRAGTIQFQSGRYEAAIQSFEDAIKAAPGYAPAYVNLGTVYIRLKKYDKAKQVLQRAVIEDPSNGNARNQLGVVYF